MHDRMYGIAGNYNTSHRDMASLSCGTGIGHNCPDYHGGCSQQHLHGFHYALQIGIFNFCLSQNILVKGYRFF